ncbi:hypothetical protein [Vibrio sp. 99-8-1]|uniref:hypothetical protein n=1 Tax=Vibrio sp. 99-8-1 TaxID=2607602 RepID=UPI00149363E7|nr:hypothetical protein [Vibrio sp. 99-8-1]NOI65396.1 hypothetical protein [Vibrio sp. 99-8-1]
MRLITQIALILALTSCATQAKYSDEVMYDLASVLKDVSQAVDGELKFGNTANLTNDAIIKNATSSNPKQLTRLVELAKEGNITDYRIISQFQGDNAVMMICDGEVALMEDAGCNAEFDTPYWNNPQPNSCAITLNAAEVCSD